MENKEEMKNEKINNEKPNNNTTQAIFSLIAIIIVVGLGVYFWTSAGTDSTDYRNTTWTSTDGYTINIKSDSCYLSKDGKKLNNECKFTTNSNGSGIGKLEICDASGLDCSSKDLTSKIRSNTKNYIMIYGRTFYLQ